MFFMFITCQFQFHVLLTAFYFNSAILAIKWIIVKVHHACKCCGKSHSVRHASISIETHHFVFLRYIMEKAESKESFKLQKEGKFDSSTFNKSLFYLFLSLAKKVSGTQIFSAKSPDKVSTSSSELKASRSSFQYWFRYMVIV